MASNNWESSQIMIHKISNTVVMRELKALYGKLKKERLVMSDVVEKKMTCVMVRRREESELEREYVWKQWYNKLKMKLLKLYSKELLWIFWMREKEGVRENWKHEELEATSTEIMQMHAYKPSKSNENDLKK